MEEDQQSSSVDWEDRFFGGKEPNQCQNRKMPNKVILLKKKWFGG